MKLKYLISKQNIRKIFSRQIIITLLVGVFTFGLIYGCGTMPGHVYKEWSRTMAQLGIFPVFPPREDVQVGDVWLLPMHPLDATAVELVGGMGKTGIWIDNILQTPESGTNTPIQFSDVNNFYKNRFSFPSSSLVGTSTSFGTETVVKLTKVPTITGTDTIYSYGTDTTTRLRQVAFPDFAVTNIRQGSLSALIPIEALSLAGGFSFNDIEQVSLKIPSAESYGLPAQYLLRMFIRNGLRKGEGNDYGKLFLKESIPNENVGVRGLDINTARMTRSMFNETFENIKKNLPWYSIFSKHKLAKGLKDSEDYIWVGIVNEVFYARAIDIGISRKTARGAAVNVELMSDEMISQLQRLAEIRSGTETITTTTETVGTSTKRTIVKNEGLTNKEDAFTLAQKMNEFNQNVSQQSIIGGSISAVSVTDKSVGMRRFYDKPVAVGVRGLIMRINSSTLEVKLGELSELNMSGE